MRPRTINARIDKLESLIPGDPLPYWVQAVWNKKEKTWVATADTGASVKAPKLKQLRKEVKKKFGKNVTLIEIARKPTKIPEKYLGQTREVGLHGKEQYRIIE